MQTSVFMTNRSMSSKSDRAPFLLAPVGKDYLWGGQRLNDIFSKGIDMDPLAETWECSTHPDGPSVVASGPYRGMTLKQVLEEHPEFLGTRQRASKGLPILIKLIDARKNLSVQVHPDDAYAESHERGSLGKTEMWYVLDAVEDAKLIYGFYRDMDKETVRKSIQDGTIEKYLQKVPVKKDDVFFIPAGQVHAIGKGALIAEIQQSSNLTYRMYDYGRLDKNGSPRQLHVEKALDVADLKGSKEPRSPMRVLKYQNGRAIELLCRCQYFQVWRMIMNTHRSRQMAEFKTGSNSFQVLLCTEGCGTLWWGQENLNFFSGDCIFIPAGTEGIKMHGRAQLLKVEC